MTVVTSEGTALEPPAQDLGHSRPLVQGDSSHCPPPQAGEHAGATAAPLAPQASSLSPRTVERVPATGLPQDHHLHATEIMFLKGN